MRKNLRMNHEIISVRKSNFGKCLVAFGLLMGMQSGALAQNDSMFTSYYKTFGTDFDPVAGDTFAQGAKISKDILHHIDDYNIILDESNQLEYRLGNNAGAFFGQVPAMESVEGTVGKDNYMFVDGNINGDLFKLKFPTAEYAGKAYKFSMRAYIQLDSLCGDGNWDNAKISLHSEHGNDASNFVEVSAYDNTAQLLGTKKIDGTEALLLSDLIDSAFIANMNATDLIRLEFAFYGSFPAATNGLAYFVLAPRFQEFSCTKLAIDHVGGKNKTQNPSDQNPSDDNSDLVGTDFDPVAGDTFAQGAKISKDILQHFSDYNIILDESNQLEYRLGNNAGAFFGNVPAMESVEGTVGKDNYMFVDGNINGDLFKLKFPTAEYAGKNYKFTMRAYIQLDSLCGDGNWENAKISLHSEHGNDASNFVEVSAYDNTAQLLGTKKIDGTEALLLSDLIDSAFIANMNATDLIRLEFAFYGSFPAATNGLAYFVLAPRFQEFSCTKLAIDNISAKKEEVVIATGVECVGETTTVNVLGFPENLHYKWYKEDASGDDILVEEGDELTKLEVYVSEIGKQNYKVVVTGFYNENGEPIRLAKELNFSIIGKNCDPTLPGDTSDIKEIDAVDVNSVVNVYTIDGVVLKSNVKLSEALLDLKKGFYIVGDKKVYVRE